MAKKKTTKTASKKSVKKTATKKAVKKTTAQKTATKKTAAKKTAAKKTIKKAGKVKKGSPLKASSTATAKRDADVDIDKKAGPIAFSLDDVEAIVASREKDKKTVPQKVKKVAKPVVAPKKKIVVTEDEPVKKRVHAAASLADILGFNPAQKKPATSLEEDEVPKKWKKYYKLLKELRSHVRDEIDLHTADTLKHSSRDENGNGNSYGNHQADAGTDEFDRDFALSLVSNEQEALHEIEEAINRIKNGTYGTCEVTGKPINKERLEAVPFARFSIEGQSEYEKNKRRRVDRNVGGLFADNSDAPKITSDDDDE